MSENIEFAESLCSSEAFWKLSVVKSKKILFSVVFSVVHVEISFKILVVKMSIDEVTCGFEIDIKFTEISLKNVEDGEIKQFELELVFMGKTFKPLQTSMESSMLLTNGAHDCDLQFKLANSESGLPNEEFNFYALGDLLIGEYFTIQKGQ